MGLTDFTKELMHITEIQELKGQIDILNRQLYDQDKVIENLKQEIKGLKAQIKDYKDAIRRL